jgi:hypothetical protein
VESSSAGGIAGTAASLIAAVSAGHACVPCKLLVLSGLDVAVYSGSAGGIAGTAASLIAAVSACNVCVVVSCWCTSSALRLQLLFQHCKRQCRWHCRHSSLTECCGKCRPGLSSLKLLVHHAVAAAGSCLSAAALVALQAQQSHSSLR